MNRRRQYDREGVARVIITGTIAAAARRRKPSEAYPSAFSAGGGSWTTTPYQPSPL